MRNAGRKIIIAALLVIGVIYVLGEVERRREKSPEELKSAYVASQKSNARYESTSEQRTAWGKALRRAGWNCPEVKTIWWLGEDAKGVNAKVMCGPADGTKNVYKDRIFSSTMRANGVLEAKQAGLYD